MRKIIAVLLAAAITVLAYPMAAFATNTTSEAAQVQTIRVGYVPDAGVIQTPMLNGSEGYGYEYMAEILQYTTGNYLLEYVECTREDAYGKLAAGEIDLYGFSGYAEEYAATGYVYTAETFIDNILFLTSMDGEPIDTTTYAAVDGSTLGVIVNEVYAQEFLDTYGISAEIIKLTDADYQAAYQNYDLDYCIVSSLQFPTSESINILSQIDVVPLYFVSTEANAALIEDIDAAMAQIAKTEYHFEENLYLQYYDYDIQMGSYVSDDEYALLQSQDVYLVGMRDLHSPFSRIDDNGEWVGVAADFLALLVENAGITVEIVEIDDDTSAETLESLDFYFFANETVRVGSESDPYISAPLILVDHAETIETATSIGVMDYYGVYIEDGTLLGRTVTVYKSLETLVEGLNSGEVESIMLSTTSLNYIRADIEDENFLSTLMDAKMNLVVQFSEHFEQEKIDVFNKIIANIDAATLEYSLLQNATRVVQVGLVTYLEENPVVLVCAVLFVLLLAGIMDERRRRAVVKQINTDALTKLPSKARFDKEVNTRLCAWPGFGNKGKTYRLISLDIDNFKYINEIYGYEVGTQILKKVSDIIKAALSKDAIMTRTHADNFLIFIATSDYSDDVAQHLAHASEINEALSSILGTSYRFSFSVGIYDVPKHRMPINYMVDCANVARGLGKATVGTTFHKFSEEINIERAKNNEIVANMEQALQKGEFLLHYQPKVNLKTDALVGAEALVRWQRGGKMVAPYHFIPLFEKNGFVQKLDIEVLRQACVFIKAHEGQGVPKISVNLSGVTLAKPGIVQIILKMLRSHGVASSQIEIEITETAFVGNDIAQEVVTELEKQGFTISMDDFGVGISSLHRLRKLEIDTIKIDRAFIVDYLGNEKGAIILKSIIGMAKALGIETVAEGIETKEQLESLCRYGCDVGQGYYFSRPIAEEAFLRYCKNCTEKTMPT